MSTTRRKGTKEDTENKQARKNATLEEVIAAVSLDAVSCRELCSRFRQNVEILGTVPLTANLSYETGILVPAAPGSLTIIVVAKLEAIAQGELDGDEGSHAIADVTTQFVLRYSIDRSLVVSEKISHRFAALNGIYNAWPYIREALQAGTTRLGLPPFTLPVMRLPQKQSVARPNDSAT
jgi:hypothetical protein